MTTFTTQDSPAPELDSVPAPPIPWQVLDLVANILDPKTLAIASCVSKPWRSAMTSEHLWEPLCTTHFPSLSHLRSVAVPVTATELPYHHLYNLGFTATKRRQQPPLKPQISLKDLLFIITLTNSTSPPVTVIRPGSGFSPNNHKSLFRFDFDIRENAKWLEFEVSDETKVTWNVVLRGFEGVFTMMDCKGKGSFVSGSDGWFSAEMPAAGCCCAAGCGGSSGMVAEMRLVMKEEEEGGGRRRTVVGSVNVGVLSVVSWRYVGVDDGLRYLQHFLEPCNV